MTPTSIPSAYKTTTKQLPTKTHARIQNILSEGVQLIFADEGRENTNITISRPSSARHWNAILMAFRWRADNGPPLNAGLLTLWF